MRSGFAGESTAQHEFTAAPAIVSEHACDECFAAATESFYDHDEWAIAAWSVQMGSGGVKNCLLIGCEADSGGQEHTLDWRFGIIG